MLFFVKYCTNRYDLWSLKEPLLISGAWLEISIHGCHYIIQGSPKNGFHRTFHVESENFTGARHPWPVLKKALHDVEFRIVAFKVFELS